MNVAMVAAVMIMLASCPMCASAAFYRYYDESGGINVTNDYKSIPERYRANVTVTTEKELEKKAAMRERQEYAESNETAGRERQPVRKNVPVQSVTTEPAPVSSLAPSPGQKGVEPPVPADSGSWLSRQVPLLKIMGVMVLAVTAFVFAGRLVSVLAPRSLAIIIKVALFAAMMVYLFKGYSEKVVAAFARIKDESHSAQRAVDKRSEKIRQQAE